MSEEAPKEARIVNYPSNRHRDRDQPTAVPAKRVEKVISGEVVQRKRPLGRRIADTFTGDDMHSVGAYIVLDVLVPAAKAMIADAASQGVERFLFGDSRPRVSQGRSNHYTSYNRMYSATGTTNRREEPRTLSQRARATHDFGEVILGSRGEAEDVLDRLGALVDQYDVATVADLYELVGITGTFTDAKWGWSDLRGSDVRRVRDGYLLVLPNTAPID